MAVSIAVPTTEARHNPFLVSLSGYQTKPFQAVEVVVISRPIRGLADTAKPFLSVTYWWEQKMNGVTLSSSGSRGDSPFHPPVNKRSSIQKWTKTHSFFYRHRGLGNNAFWEEYLVPHWQINKLCVHAQPKGRAIAKSSLLPANGA